MNYAVISMSSMLIHGNSGPRVADFGVDDCTNDTSFVMSSGPVSPNALFRRFLPDRAAFGVISFGNKNLFAL